MFYTFQVLIQECLSDNTIAVEIHPVNNLQHQLPTRNQYYITMHVTDMKVGLEPYIYIHPNSS